MWSTRRNDGRPDTVPIPTADIRTVERRIERMFQNLLLQEPDKCGNFVPVLRNISFPLQGLPYMHVFCNTIQRRLLTQKCRKAMEKPSI